MSENELKSGKPAQISKTVHANLQMSKVVSKLASGRNNALR